MSGTDIAYVSWVQTAWHVAMLLAAFFGFTGLALASERYAPQLIGKVPPPPFRFGARIAGWVLLTVALILAVAYLNADTGITIWLGWLSVAGLVLVFGLAKWTRQPARKTKERPIAPPDTLPPVRVLRGIGVAGLIATAAVFAYLLMGATS